MDSEYNEYVRHMLDIKYGVVNFLPSNWTSIQKGC